MQPQEQNIQTSLCFQKKIFFKIAVLLKMGGSLSTQTRCNLLIIHRQTTSVHSALHVLAHFCQPKGPAQDPLPPGRCPRSPLLIVITNIPLPCSPAALPLSSLNIKCFMCTVYVFCHLSITFPLRL